MKCPDCGIELTEENKVKRGKHIGLCRKCFKRIQSNEYLNRKNGTNKKYIPIKDLKYVDPVEYNRVMGRRLSELNKQKTKTKKIVKNNILKNESNKEDVKLTYYSKVSKDLNKAFEESNINTDYLKYSNLPLWINTFISLLSEDENSNFVMQCKKGEIIFNNLFNLYQHERENLDWDDIESINNIGYAEKALQELRRPTKELLDYYYSIDPIVEHLKQDKELLDLINIAKEELKNKEEAHKNPVFYSKVNSDLVEVVNISKTNVETKTKLFDCTVWCYNLNGNPRKSLFRVNDGMRARNEVDAKLRFKTFLREKFSSVIYNDNDISIKEVSSKKEIEELARKSCS